MHQELLIGVTCLAMVIAVSGCQSNLVQENAVSAIEKKCGTQKECTIDLAGAIPFEWDHAYQFAGFYTGNEISEAIGFECDCEHVPDNRIRLVFTKGEKVVYQEQYDQFSDFYFVSAGEIKHQVLDFTPESAVFNVTKVEREIASNSAYVLAPAERADSLNVNSSAVVDSLAE